MSLFTSESESLNNLILIQWLWFTSCRVVKKKGKIFLLQKTKNTWQNNTSTSLDYPVLCDNTQDNFRYNIYYTVLTALISCGWVTGVLLARQNLHQWPWKTQSMSSFFLSLKHRGLYPIHSSSKLTYTCFRSELSTAVFYLIFTWMKFSPYFIFYW